MYVLDRKEFLNAVKNKGFKSIEALAKKLKIHRNTINYYLKGNGVVPNSLGKLLEALDLTPANAFIRKRSEIMIPQEPIANLIDQLHKKFHELSFVLFGSHTKGVTHKYSDFDIGVFKEGGLHHELFSDLLLAKNELEEDLPFFVDLVNLNNADPYFLRNISTSWMFLTGKQKDWINLKRRTLQNDN